MEDTRNTEPPSPLLYTPGPVDGPQSRSRRPTPRPQLPPPPNSLQRGPGAGDAERGPWDGEDEEQHAGRVVAAAEGEGGTVRVCGAPAVDVVRVALFALRLRVGERALEVGRWWVLGRADLACYLRLVDAVVECATASAVLLPRVLSPSIRSVIVARETFGCVVDIIDAWPCFFLLAYLSSSTPPSILSAHAH